MGECRECRWWMGSRRARQHHHCRLLSEQLTPLAPSDAIAMAGGGYQSGADLARAQNAGIAWLIGWFATAPTFGCNQFAPRVVTVGSVSPDCEVTYQTVPKAEP